MTPERSIKEQKEPVVLPALPVALPALPVALPALPVQIKKEKHNSKKNQAEPRGSAAARKIKNNANRIYVNK